MTTADILRAAKAHLIERGWCQGDDLAMNGPPDGPCCAGTAMLPFTGTLGRKCMVPGEMFRRANGIDSNIGTWNDAPERTFDEVLAAYDKAITAADLAVTADELRSMPMPKAIVAFLRACRTFDEVGDIDGPWHKEAKPFLIEAAGAADWAEYLALEATASRDQSFAVIDKAIAAAEERANAADPAA